MRTLKVIAAMALVVTLSSACSSGGSRADINRDAASPLSEDQLHRLYAAALAASDSPLDTDTFKDVCQRIGIFDADGKPNDQYMAFVSQHVEWGMKPETDQFRREINSKDKAAEYIKRHLPAR